MIILIPAILNIVGACLAAKGNVVQNRKKSGRLLDGLDAIQPALKTLERANEVSIAHEETLKQLKAVVERARELLQRQYTRGYMSQLMNQTAVTGEFADVVQGLHMHVQALNLSVDVLARVSAETRDADARDDVADMQKELARMTEDNPAELREQLEGVEAGQEARACEMLDDIKAHHAGLRRGIAADMERLFVKVLNRRGGDGHSPAQAASLYLTSTWRRICGVAAVATTTTCWVSVDLAR
jgi:hypothetical protein